MIILVSSLSSLFYHWGILQRLVHAMAVVMQRSMGTSGSESLAAAANIFMGQTEAPLIIKPYLRGMTRSEILALMTSGMATIAGGVMAVYVALGASSGHLLSASVMSAPAALMIAKIMLPETEPSETAREAPLKIERTAVNSIDALCRGATDGLYLSLNVIAMLITFVAVVALANFLFAKALSVFGVSMTLQQAIGCVNAPVAWLLGVPWKDCPLIGEILGERIVLNEFIGYLHLTRSQAELDPRSFTLATYALCGFANFGSIAIQIGGIGALVPERRADLAQLGLRAMIGGLLASYLTAAIVGLLI
jgi:CNT family concentrative nucleoside transporter